MGKNVNFQIIISMPRYLDETYFTLEDNIKYICRIIEACLLAIIVRNYRKAIS